MTSAIGSRPWVGLDHGHRLVRPDVNAHAGAGCAGLRHILKLNPDVIKLDITLTRDVDKDASKRSLAESR